MVDPGLLISGSRRIHPLLLAVIPLTALILTTRWQLHRTEGAPTLARLGWAMVVGFPFGLLMLAFAIIGGESDSTNISPSAGSAFALGLVWGALGGFIGAVTKLPLDELTARGAADAAHRRHGHGGHAAPARRRCSSRARRSRSSAGWCRSAPTPAASAPTAARPPR